MPEEKFFADSATEVGLNPDKVQALMDRAERDVKEGILPACQVAIARKGKIAAMKTFGRAVQGAVEKPATDVLRRDVCDQGDNLVFPVAAHPGRESQSGRQDRQVRAGIWHER
jgi:hypothetical protein